ncbi:MAG TPA: cupin domain-containing protein [bacterium]|nr:cupin domain-containing protein [bacterium]
MSQETEKQTLESLRGHSQPVDRLAEYQAGSIVSTRIIQKKAGNVTAFAFDQGQELSEHTAPFDALVTLVDGEANIMVGGSWNKMRSGEAILLPANVPHAVKAVTRFKMLLTMIRS